MLNRVNAGLKAALGQSVSCTAAKLCAKLNNTRVNASSRRGRR
jgi:hypothetical protein